MAHRNRGVGWTNALLALCLLVITLVGCGGVEGGRLRAFDVGDLLRVRGVKVAGTLNAARPLLKAWAWRSRVWVPSFVDPGDVVAVDVGVGTISRWTVTWGGAGPLPEAPYPRVLRIAGARWIIYVDAGSTTERIEVVLDPGLDLVLDDGCATATCSYRYADPATARRAFAFSLEAEAFERGWWSAWLAGGGHLMAEVFLEVTVVASEPYRRHQNIEFELVSSGTTVFVRPSGSAGRVAYP